MDLALLSSAGDEKVNVYNDAVTFLKTVEPGIYLRMDTQMFKTIAKPDIRVVLRSITEITLLIVPQQLLELLKETISVIDVATTNDLLGVVNATVRVDCWFENVDPICSSGCCNH